MRRNVGSSSRGTPFQHDRVISTRSATSAYRQRVSPPGKARRRYQSQHRYRHREHLRRKTSTTRRSTILLANGETELGIFLSVIALILAEHFIITDFISITAARIFIYNRRFSISR